MNEPKGFFGKLVHIFVWMPLMAVVILFAIIVHWIVDLSATRRWPGRGFKYIYRNEDGTARELTAEEQAYLLKYFRPGDGARPAIKWHYSYRFPSGRLAGFLKRRHLPWGIKVGPAIGREGPGPPI